MEALLIIDMQVGVFRLSKRYDEIGIVKRINQVADLFRKNKKPVIFIQHDGTKENYLHTGTEDWKILPELRRLDLDLHVEKEANDSFYKNNLSALLEELKIDHLYITGCATDFCVNATIHSALVKDFDLTIVKDCHTTADSPDLKAEENIKFHNWLWANLTPTKGKIRIINSNEIQ
ncbi:isochorismatase family protein [Thermodesulfobacteriota bacterium]